MKKLLAVIVMAVLLCTLLVSNVFAATITTGPSLPIGLAGITQAGYLLDGELGGSDADKYDTNLPLGEITENIKAAPSPNGKKAVATAPVEEIVEEVIEEVVEEIVEEVIEEIVEEVEGVIGEVDALEPDYVVMMDDAPVFYFNSAALLAAYVPEEAVIVADEAGWALIEEDGAVTLEDGKFCFVANADGVVSICYNMSGADLEVDVAAGDYVLVYGFTAEIEDMDFVGAIVSAYAEIGAFYAGLELDVELAISLSVVMPTDLDSMVLTVVPVPAE